MLTIRQLPIIRYGSFEEPQLALAEVGDSNRESLPRSPTQTDLTVEGSQAQPLTRLISPDILSNLLIQVWA